MIGPLEHYCAQLTNAKSELAKSLDRKKSFWKYLRCFEIEANTEEIVSNFRKCDQEKSNPPNLRWSLKENIKKCIEFLHFSIPHWMGKLCPFSFVTFLLVKKFHHHYIWLNNTIERDIKMCLLSMAKQKKKRALWGQMPCMNTPQHLFTTLLKPTSPSCRSIFGWCRTFLVAEIRGRFL